MREFSLDDFCDAFGSQHCGQGNCRALDATGEVVLTYLSVEVFKSI